jgi:hypothetical protein
MLTILNGPDSNYKLMLLAFEKPPCLVIDCANYSDPHRFFGTVPEEKLDRVYVLNAEAIYRFRDTLKMVPYWLERLKIKNVFVTTIGTLFSYDDSEEDMEVIENCWEIMRQLSAKYDVYAAADQTGKYKAFPEKYSDRMIGGDL